MVKVMEIDGQGRINLSRKAVLTGTSGNGAHEHPEPARSGGGHGEHGDHGGQGGGERRQRRPRRRLE
jgi:hypothetical protein